MRIMLANFTKMAGDTGGLAKITCEFANAMVKRGHEVSLVFSDERSGDFFYKIDNRVATYDLRLQSGKRIEYPLYLKAKRELLRAFDQRRGRSVNHDFFEKYLLNELRKTLALINPDIIISFQPAASKYLLCDLDTKIPVITMSHGDPEDYFHTYPKKEIPALEKSAVCQVLLPSFEEHITKYLPKCKTITIGNAVTQCEHPVNLSLEKDIYKIIFIGRLNRNHKRPHLLIEAFGKVSQEFPTWQVELWGARDRKEYYRELESLIRKYKLENRVFIKGTSNDVSSVLQNGDIFVIPSAYEGFGLSLAEAMSAGLPAVGYKGCPAVNELIIDGENGLLCDDGVDDLANRLKLIMGDPSLRVRLGTKAHESVQKYAPEHIWDKWEELMEDILQRKV